MSILSKEFDISKAIARGAPQTLSNDLQSSEKTKSHWKPEKRPDTFFYKKTIFLPEPQYS